MCPKRVTIVTRLGQQRAGVFLGSTREAPSSLRTCSPALNRRRHADFSPPDRGDVGRHRKLQARGSVRGSCGLKSACRFMGSTVRGLRPVCDGSNWPRWRRAWQTARHMFRRKQRPVCHWCGLLARWEAWFLRFGDVDLGDGADSLWLASIPFRRVFLNSPEGRPETWFTRNHSVHP